MDVPPIGTNRVSAPDLERIVEETAAENLGDPERIERFRRRALDAYGGRVPQSARAEYSAALLKLVAPQHRIAELRATTSLPDSITGAERTISTCEHQLAELEAANQRWYSAATDTIGAAQNALAGVLTDKSVENDRRVEAIFGIFANNERLGRLNAAWGAYQSKQAQFRDTLEGLKKTEAKLDAASGNALRTYFQRRRSISLLVRNLKEQIELLGQLIQHASNTGHAFAAVQAALQASLESTRAWAASVRDEGREVVLSEILDLAGLIGEALLPGPVLALLAPALSLARAALLEDVDGVRETAEMFVWRSLAQLLSDGLVEAGMGESVARALVTALRVGGQAATGRAAAEALVTPEIRGTLSEAQSLVIQFLLDGADEALPLSAIARAVIDLGGLSMDDARQIVASLSQVGSGVDGALSVLEAAAR
jgi:hypothetical protein